MLSTLDRRTIYTGNGSNANFDYTFKVHLDAHLKVFVDGVDSSVTTYGRNADQESSPGGTLTMLTAPINGASVVVMRVMPETQTTDYIPYGDFPSTSHEARLDEIVMSIQEHSDELSRAVVAPIDDDGTTDYELPLPVASYILGWNAAGDALVNYVPDGVPTITYPGISDSATAVKLTITNALTSISNQFAISAGSVGAPALAPIGDLNTGIFFPAVDIMAFGTGGSETMRINADGHIGIKSTSFESWNVGSSVIQFGLLAYVSNSNAVTELNLGYNAYESAAGIWKRSATGFGNTQLSLGSTIIKFNMAASGAADSTITWIPVLQVEEASALGANETSLWIYDNDSAAPQQIKAGAASSGSLANHRMLQIPN